MCFHNINGKLDLNVNNYTFEELLRILKIKEPTVENIDVTISTLKTKYANDANLLNFFDEILEKLMSNRSLNDSDIVMIHMITTITKIHR